MAYTPKNILVTGGAGFIASHVVIRLVKSYPHYNIVNFDKLDYCSSLLNLREIENFPNYKFINGNICSPDFVEYVLKSEKIDTILHLAAHTHVDNSFGNSLLFTQNNIMGTHVLLEAAKCHGIKRFVHISTDEVYGEIHADAASAKELETILNPTNPYAATKAGAEFLVRAYHRSFGLPIVITRGNNVYGPHQYPEKIIPKFICLLKNGKPCYVHGDGQHRRNFLFVTDVARALDIVMHKGEIGEIYNIGTDFDLSNLEVARKLIALFGLTDRESEFLKFVEDRPFNDFRYAIDLTRLKNLGWAPEVDWDDGLQRTIEWYKEFEGNWGNLSDVLVAHPRRGVEK